MQRKCLKCGLANPSAAGGPFEACPQCGAIYSRVENARANAPSNLARVRMASAKEEENKRTAWKYWALGAVLCITVPATVYQYTWGTVAKQRQAAAINAVNQASQQAARPAVFNSPLNGSVLQVERYLKANTKDPASLEFLEWSPVASGPESTFVVRVKFRAKNSLGGNSVEQHVFKLSPSGEVISASPL